MLQARAEAQDEPCHDGNSGIQTQLLERHNARECFEQAREARGTHAPKCAALGANRSLGKHAAQQWRRVDIESEDPVNGRASFDLRTRGLDAGAN